MTRKIVTTLALIAALALTAIAQQPIPKGPSVAQVPDDSKAVKQDAAPTLTTEQKQQLQLVALQMENWQLKAQQAASEFEKARGQLQQLIVAMTPPGYVLTDKLELQKTEGPKKEPEKQ